MKMCRATVSPSPVLSDKKLLKVSNVAPGLRDLIGPADNLSC